jgi:hypothetical protein
LKGLAPDEAERVLALGKRTVMKGGRKFYGYNPQARECSQECPDRHICRVMVRKLPPAK